MRQYLCVTIILLLFSFNIAQSETVPSIPQLINYQGMLTNAEGQPLETKEYKLSFSIFNQPTAGEAVWGPQIFDGRYGDGRGAKVPVVRGHFNVILGDKDINGRLIIEAFQSKDAYLEIIIENNSPISPRQQILSSPYAVQSEKANTVENGAITNKNIADHSIGVEKLNFSDDSGNVSHSGNLFVKKEIIVGEEQNNTIITADKIGVGVNNPTKNLEINGNIGFTGGKGPFCIFSTECPDGWVNRGEIGFISKKCPYKMGADYSGWDWCHPQLCCNE
jgi:hypothetical protein